MLYVPAYTYERKPYSATLYPTSFSLDALLALTISAQCKTYGWYSTPGPMAGGDFLRRKKMCAGKVRTRGWNDDTTAAVRCNGLMGGAKLLDLEGEVTRRVGRGAPCLSDSRLDLLRQAASN